MACRGCQTGAPPRAWVFPAVGQIPRPVPEQKPVMRALSG
ncbi:hypothetical protein CV83915_00402 [Escherichia coli]|uniref:Uncharacterized protein n=1 Tax=Escherichia coli TaxID=562 RepID=A0A2H4TMJ2_ECOLX|nr:hypothetical protein CV83915_00402 [Escherichia coli]